jgi:hypothetical protein
MVDSLHGLIVEIHPIMKKLDQVLESMDCENKFP